jgi:hypothetical protein
LDTHVRLATLCATLCFALASHAAAPIRILPVDLAPLIDAAARHPGRFAVEVPHVVSTATAGEWSEAAGEARWHYAVRVPGAVSLSLHATGVTLPPDATLAIAGAGARYIVNAHDLHGDALWSRILRGDAVDLTLSVPAAGRDSVRFSIVALQAGYRGLGAGARNHPHYDELRRRGASGAGLGAAADTPGASASANPNAGCIENYECDATAANIGNAHATVALIVANLVQCTGVLVGNARNDGIPYLVTARHCEQDTDNGGAPANAAATTVYWDAVTSPCGTTLGDLYDPMIVTQTGAATVVEQQDVWLIRLNESPIIANPYFAGFDVSGNAVAGGYTLHHALSTKKQFVGWYGNAAPWSTVATELGAGYTSNLLGVSSQKGFFGPGASGAGLFDANDHLVGTASLDRETNGGPGSCPVTPLAPPSPATAGAYFTSFGAVWHSTADATSTTGAATLASVLDPDNTAVQVLAGASGLDPLVLTSSLPIAQAGTAVTLSWTAATATACTADGGVSGDGWSGNQALHGPFNVTDPTPGSAPVPYGITCTYPSGRVSHASVSISWTGIQPFGTLSAGSGAVVWVGAPYVVSWSANVGPCAISTNVPTGTGTGVLTGLRATGTATLVFTSAQTDGETTLSCGSGNTQLAHTAFSTIAPAFTFTANSTDRVLGQPLSLSWHSIADYCTPTGGAPNDGWITAQRAPYSGFSPLVTAVGTYTYGLTCTSGTVSVSSQVTVTVTNAAPYVTLQVAPTSVLVGGQYTVTIQSNIDGCYLGGVPGLASPTAVTAQSTLNLVASPVGNDTLQVSCSSNGLSAVSPAVALTVAPLPAPVVNLAVSSNTVAANTAVTVSWTSTNATACTASGGSGFSGTEATAGSASVAAASPGTLTLTLACVGNGQTTSASQMITVTSPPSSGGGALDPWLLGLLAALLAVNAWRPVPRRG